MGEEDEQMQTQEQIAALNRALVLQNRSALQYSVTAGSLLGFEYAAITGELARFAQPSSRTLATWWRRSWLSGAIQPRRWRP